MKRLDQLTQLTAAQLAQDDIIGIRDQSAGQTKYITVKDLTGAPEFGWQATGESWSFSSFNSTSRLGVITVPTNATTKYSVGMWVRIAQTTGGTKYGKITAVTATTITVNFFNAYTLNNEAITSPVFSPLAQPYGAPSLPVSYTDANGYKVRDFGTYKTYNKVINFTGSSVGPSGRFIAAGILWPVNTTPSDCSLAITEQLGFSGHISGSYEWTGNGVGNANFDYYVSSMYNGGALNPGTGRLHIVGMDIN